MGAKRLKSTAKIIGDDNNTMKANEGSGDGKTKKNLRKIKQQKKFNRRPSKLHRTEAIE